MICDMAEGGGDDDEFLKTGTLSEERKWIIKHYTKAAILTSSNLMHGAAGGSPKYTHGPLVSALSAGRSHDFGPQVNAVSGDSGGDADSDARSSSNVSGKSKSGSSGPGRGDGALLERTDTGVTGGEVLVPKSFPAGSQEPTCEQLRAMWIFSKRQSRAAEITNEIPTYRDPFAYNIWEPYYSTTRSVGAVRMVPRYGERPRSPVFGRIINREPAMQQRMPISFRQRHYNVGTDSMLPVRSFSSEPRHIYNSGGGGAGATARRPATAYRYVGGSSSSALSGNSAANPNSVAVQGSFQKLKELIWTERAKELTQQRHAEELAARAAVLKDIANGQIHQPSYKHNYKSESPLMDENRSPDRDGYQQNSGRVPFASGQSQKNNGNSNSDKKGHSPSSTRSYTKGHKGSVFSGNSANPHARGSGRLMLPSMASGSNYNVDEASVQRSGHDRYSNAGVPKAYPLRPSHFRERNRSLLKQNSPAGYFHRNLRRLAPFSLSHFDLPTSDENSLLDHIIQHLSTEKNMRNKVMAEDNEKLWVSDYRPDTPTAYEKLLDIRAEDSNPVDGHTTREQFFDMASGGPFDTRPDYNGYSHNEDIQAADEDDSEDLADGISYNQELLNNQAEVFDIPDQHLNDGLMKFNSYY